MPAAVTDVLIGRSFVRSVCITCFCSDYADKLIKELLRSPEAAACKIDYFYILRYLHSSFSCHDLSGPGVDPAEFVDVGISHVRKLLRCLLGSVPASAVNQDDLIQIREFFRPLRFNALIRN